MKPRLITAFLILVLAVTFIGTAGPTVAQKGSNELSLSIANNGENVWLARDDTLVLNLEANPSTGYYWQPKLNGKVLRQLNDFEFTPFGEGSTAGVQTLRFAGVSAGQTTLELVYARPWEDVDPLYTMSVQVNSEGAFRGTYQAAPAVEQPVIDEVTAPGLLSSYNYCSNIGGCTIVKNQGSCGSCWAFAAVGVYEQLIKGKDGVTRDLSEQYLVSCNYDGWSCAGGWCPFGYFINKVPSGEPNARAVYESTMPYTGRDDPCYAPHSHGSEIAQSWNEIASSPSVTQIKNAIQQYGPLWVGVCADSSMSNYNGGVFGYTTCTQLNHAVVLYGWDDSQGSNGVWFMRNSWGTSWGENGGNMRIGYGVNGIGAKASYLSYQGTGPTPTPPPPPTPTPPPNPTPTPPPGDVVFEDNFETDKGWTLQSGTATTGNWERANPAETSYSGTVFQLGTTASGSYDLSTGPLAGSSVGDYDIDGGYTIIRSPNIALPDNSGPTYADITLSFKYYLAHYNNSGSDDYLRVTVVSDGGPTAEEVVLEELGGADIDGGAWANFSTNLNAFAGQTIYLEIEAADAGSGSLVEAGIDDVLITGSGGPDPTPPPPTPTPGVIFYDDFETSTGWTRLTDTATTGIWERANPEETSYSGTVYQLGTTPSGSYDLVTGPLAGSSIGSYDIDGGYTGVRSPDIQLPSSGNISISFKYYLAHYNNSDSNDYLRVQVVGNTTETLLVEYGAANIDGAAWATYNGNLNAFAGQTVYLTIQAADGGGASLVEAAIDDVLIE